LIRRIARELVLGHNQLASLPAEVGSLTVLQTLLLDHNQLAPLSASISRLA
jgi:Leucine-rich repeat (LRR) protein